MRLLTSAVATFAGLVLPFASAAARAVAATASSVKKKTVWKRVTGPQEQADRWGPLQISIVVRKTTTTRKVGGHTKTQVTRRITGVRVPIYPDHTGRSVFINEQALPILVSETLHAQLSPNIDLISGATYTSEAYIESLQAAIVKARKI